MGRKRTVNFRNQHLGRHLATDYTIIMSRTLKVTDNHVMYGRSAWFPRVIMSSSHALCCLLSNMTSLRRRRLEVVGAWKNGRAGGKQARGETFSAAVRDINNRPQVASEYKFMPLVSVSFHQSCPSFDGMRSIDNTIRQILLSKE